MSDRVALLLARTNAATQRPERAMEGSGSTAPLKLTAQDVAAALARLDTLGQLVMGWAYLSHGGARLREQIELMGHLQLRNEDHARDDTRKIERMAELIMVELARGRGNEKRPAGRTCAAYLGVSDAWWRRKWRDRYRELAALVWSVHDQAAREIKRALRD